MNNIKWMYDQELWEIISKDYENYSIDFDGD